MSYYDMLRYYQYEEERRQDSNDKIIHPNFAGDLKPDDAQILERLKTECRQFIKNAPKERQFLKGCIVN
jgi:lauroyl/myristoyl acyltransferase